jgi:hypothetical protein
MKTIRTEKGNSEVGHMNLGAGRIVLPPLPGVPLSEGHAGVFLHAEEDNGQNQEEKEDLPAEQDQGEQDRHGDDRREPALQV